MIKIPLQVFIDVAEAVAEDGRDLLESLDKVATGKTAESLEPFASAVSDGYEFGVQGVEGLQYIISGREPGGKMPGRVVGDKFEPFPELKEWFQARGIPEEAEWPVMRKIAYDGIEPVDLAGQLADQATKTTTNKLIKVVPDIFSKEIGAALRVIYK